MSGWIADMADAVDAHEAAKAPLHENILLLPRDTALRRVLGSAS